jgi:tetratricopeptide (TPR) repeat protein
MKVALLGLHKVIQLNANDAIAYYNRATCKCGVGRLRRRTSDMDEAIRIDAKTHPFTNQRGNFYYQLKEKEKACFDWRRAVEFGDEKARYQITQYCK